MKTIIKTFLVIPFMFSCGSKVQSTQTIITTESDTTMTTFALVDTTIVPKEYTEVIEKADSVKWFLIDAFVSEEQLTNLPNLEGEILSCEIDYNPNRIGALKTTLLYPNSFEQKDYVKECTFMPDVAVEFVHQSDTVFVAYSFYCDMVRFIKSDLYKEYDGELIRKSMLVFASEVFPKDKYLRTLKRREQ